jgi:hypothetical protein
MATVGPAFFKIDLSKTRVGTHMFLIELNILRSATQGAIDALTSNNHPASQVKRSGQGQLLLLKLQRIFDSDVLIKKDNLVHVFCAAHVRLLIPSIAQNRIIFKNY